MRKQGSDNPSPARKKLVKYLIEREPNLTDRSVEPVLNGIARFVKLGAGIQITSSEGVKVSFREVLKNDKKL